MGAFHDGLSTHLLDPAIDCGNWTDLQSKIAESCPQSLERLSEEVASSLAKLELRFQSYITTDSFKRSLRRR